MTASSADSLIPDPPNRTEADALRDRIERAAVFGKYALNDSCNADVPLIRRAIRRREAMLHMIDILEGRA